MKKMMNRINKKEGFTLAELLIVVAIIAVLVAVSIPVFTSRLEKAREATDVANFRAAYAAAVAEYLGNESKYNVDTPVPVYYDAGQGKIVDGKPSGYLKGTTADGKTTAKIGTFEYIATGTGSDYAGKVIQVTIAKDGVVTLAAVN